MRLLLTFLSFVLLSVCMLAQSYRFNQYTTEDGISQNFIYSIDQDQRGYLWVGTGEGLCRFDGRKFITYTTDDGLAEDVITCSFIDTEGNIWLGHNSGSVSYVETHSGAINSYSNPELTQSTITGICEVNGIIFFLSQNDGMFKLVDDDFVSVGEYGAAAYYSISVINENHVIIGTSAGLYHIKNDGGHWVHQNTYLENSWVSVITESNEVGVFLIGMESDGVVKCRLSNDGLQFSSWDGKYTMKDLAIRALFEDYDNNIWIGTYGQGLIKVHTDSVGLATGEKTIYNSETGMATNHVQCVFQDREGNIWVGTFGAGLSTLIDDFFTFYAHDPNAFGNSVSALLIDETSSWFGVENGLIQISDEIDGRWKFYTDTSGLVNDEVTYLHEFNTDIFIGTAGNGMYSFNKITGKIVSVSWNYGSLANSINQIIDDGDLLWVATDGGVVIYNPMSGETDILTTDKGLPHNVINSIYQSSDGYIWIGTHSRFVYVINQAEYIEYEITNSGQLDVVSITEDKNGLIWLATAESGVYKLTGSVFKNYDTRDGLKSKYCYAIHTDGVGNMWVGHRGGLSKIVTSTEVIMTYDHNSGIEGQVNLNAMYLDKLGYLWIGTTNGAIKYDPAKDKLNSTPPVVNLLSVTVGDKKYSANATIDLPYNNYRVQFEYVGINFRNPDAVTYQYKLVGHDELFSDMSGENLATYGRLSDGEYEFNVIACNEDGICSELPATIKINIAKPIWEKWWFYLIVLSVIAGIIVFLVRMRVNRLKAIQVYLEEELDKKTKEVVDKAEKIEEINKDLTDSINYAQRIQQAILPEEQVLHNNLPGSFIFYRPKDIVSGDFYFIRKIGNKLIVACADCTGHGVPGGFMSMIGAVTLKNIYSMSKWEWKAPDDVLELLDLEIQNMLQQRSDEELTPDELFFKTRDGMDITLCEIDLDTNEVLMASAMRTSLAYMGKEMHVISGDRRSIGGAEGKNISFQLQKFKFEKGDILYLFSDGFTDQFGGEDGRKLKLSGTIEIVAELNTNESADSLAVISAKFDEWQGGWAQIDDILFIALQF